ncbi:MAG: UDP-N-acetylmuramate dehydrogenase [Lachnospiraceae bacterium]|nr:UDP-N-acetylmuramate dehydrogenase [Candidatus Fimimorpha excrementavium]
MNVIERFEQIVTKENVLENESMKSHTTFQAGGDARLFVMPRNEEETAKVISICRESHVDWMILGHGSNLLVSDAGYDGVVIWLKKYMNGCRTVGNEVIAQAGAMMPTVAREAWKNGLGGLEFASGIPGTVGGGLAMNAGAYGGEMRQVVKEALVLTKEGTLRTVTNEELQLTYRHSAVQSEHWIVLQVTFSLQKKDPDDIKARMDDYNGRRREKQPLEYGSAGSTFKRPEGYFAGKLIEDAGLKGYRIGDAQVSEKHAGFVINRANATASEIWRVCCHVKKTVKEKFGVDLEMEVKTVGSFDKISEG